MLLVTTDKARHAQKRRIIDRGLSASAIKSMEENILSQVRLYCNILERGGISPDEDKSKSGSEARQWISAGDINELTHFLVFDIMGAICFNRSFNMLSESTHRWILRVLPEIGKGSNVVSALGT